MAHPDTREIPAATLERVRRGLGVLFIAGVIGTAAELLLLDHTAGIAQKVPLGLLGAAAVTATWRAATRNGAALTAFRVVMIGCVVGGAAGLWLHFSGNLEFELEMMPGLSGPALWWKALGGATPALAPAALIALGVIGWLWVTGLPEAAVGPQSDDTTASSC